jgi:hypothetical protein
VKGKWEVQVKVMGKEGEESDLNRSRASFLEGIRSPSMGE